MAVPRTGEILSRQGTAADLLALKIISEDMDLETASRATGKSLSAIHNLLLAVSESGIIIAPTTRIRRTSGQVPTANELPASMSDVQAFTLQWHITNRCDLNCRHCYDRTDREPLTTQECLVVLDDFADFCIVNNVRGHVSFSGGNPLLRADFPELYHHASDLGFELSILGNPASRQSLQKIQEVQPLDFFQTSLEGLPEHNDFIRGPNHFARVMAFAGILRELGVDSSIMLTLTRENMDQVIPLAERLEGVVDHFTYNRLSPVGQGAALALPTPEVYAKFVKDYVDAARRLPVMGYKDNLINVELNARGSERFDGCTGYGCGAAFNFMALLPDGEVHACRKYPSLIGTVRSASLAEIYSGQAAFRYRKRPEKCAFCSLISRCGGCRAITSGCGGNEDVDIDPFCLTGPLSEGETKGFRDAI